MRFTKIISVWLIGLVGQSYYEGPICKDSKVFLISVFDFFLKLKSQYQKIFFFKVIDWICTWMCKERKFPLDMGGFAINLKLFLQDKTINFAPEEKRGFLEDQFIRSLGVSFEDFEPKGNCSDILVWHTQTKKPTLKMNKQMSIDIIKNKLK